MDTCARDGCLRPPRARGYCASHYTTERLRGTFTTNAPTLEERFWAKVDRTESCWLWTSSLTHSGYGVFTVRNAPRSAHRVAYELSVGAIPDGLQLDHLCHDPRDCKLADRCPHRRCVNPAHLDAVPGKVNLQRGGGIGARNAAKTHCVNGHEFTEENTYRDPKGKDRHCVACRAATTVKRHQKRRVPISTICVECGATFEYERKGGAPPNRCSSECRRVMQRRLGRECDRRRRAAARVAQQA